MNCRRLAAVLAAGTLAPVLPLDVAETHLRQARPGLRIPRGGGVIPSKGFQYDTPRLGSRAIHTVLVQYLFFCFHVFVIFGDA